MRLTIFGGTGPTGRLLIDQAVAAGHHVVAYARTPAKLPTHDRVHAIAGTLDDADRISEGVRGSDAVLSLLGPSTRADAAPLVSGYEHIIAAMRTHHVERLVVMGTAVIRDPADGRNTKIAATLGMLRLLQRPTYNAIRSIGRLVSESGLRWTIVRLPFLTGGPQTETVNSGPLGKRDSLRLSRANAAAYFLAQAVDESQLQRAPFVTDG